MTKIRSYKKELYQKLNIVAYYYLKIVVLITLITDSG